MWPSFHSFIQETPPNILGQPLRWELAQRPSNGHAPGPLTTWWGLKLCHESLEGACEQFAVGIFWDSLSGEVGGLPGRRDS